jgi:site-specific DNA-methyltransferase (cytosine-N4-specific)
MDTEPSWEERPRWRKLVTPQLTRERPVYGWFVYPHSFDKDLVEELLQEMTIGPGVTVWDPFVGAGTTVLACLEYGVQAWGTDLLPLSVLVSRAKVTDYDIEDLKKALNCFDYSARKGTRDRFADIPIVAKAVPPRVRLQVSSLLEQIEALNGSNQLFFLTALLGILEDVSYAVKSGGWLRLDMSKLVSEESVRRLFAKQAEQMLADLDRGVRRNCPSSGECVWLADARTERLQTPVGAIITSPPYLNRHDYTRVFALELALVGVVDAQEMKALRYRSLRSHVEAKAPQFTVDGYRQPVPLGQCLTEIKRRGTNDGRVCNMIRGYFEDLFHVLKNAYANLAFGGRAAFVLGDVRFSGVTIPVTELTIQLGRTAGLTPEKVIVARYRGNSSQQMGVYGREKAKESVLIFQKL